MAYFKKIRGLPLTPKSLDSISYKNKKHIIIALICYLNKDEHLIQKKLILKKFSFDMGSVMRHHAEPCKRLRKTLTFKRNYSINHLIGLFSLKRNLHKDYKDIMRQQWEFYAFQSPIWQNRFNRFHAKPNMYSRQMDFINDDMLEEFYENYNYEPDEESLETQEKSIIDMKNINDDKENIDPGLTLSQLKSILEIYDVDVQKYHVNKSSEKELHFFRKKVKKITADNTKYLIINFHGKKIGMTTGGHLSPLVAYDSKSDSVLIMDVAGHKNNWYWVNIKNLFSAMNTMDGKNYRGYLVIGEKDN